MKKYVFAALFAVVALVVGVGQPVETQAAEPDGRGHGHYANVNGLRMYYEVHGHNRGQPPLVLLHGGFSSINVSFGALLPALTRRRQVIAIEAQAHGRTADINRPLRWELMADDTVELLRQLGVRQADFFGYSMGAGTALNIGVRYPNLVRKLVLTSVVYDLSGLPPDFLDNIDKVRPEDLEGSVWHQEYLRIAPRPQDFPILVEKIKDLNHHTINYPPAAISALRAPTLVGIGDADIVLPQHAVDMFRLLGGGQPNPDELAILPGTNHITMENNAKLLLPIVPTFLDRPMPS